MKLESGDYTLHEVAIDVEKEMGGSFEGSLLFLSKQDDAEKVRDFVDEWYGKPKELIESLDKLGVRLWVIGWESTDISFDGNNDESESDEEEGFDDSNYMFHPVIINECEECDDDDD